MPGAAQAQLWVGAELRAIERVLRGKIEDLAQCCAKRLFLDPLARRRRSSGSRDPEQRLRAQVGRGETPVRLRVTPLSLELGDVEKTVSAHRSRNGITAMRIG